MTDDLKAWIQGFESGCKWYNNIDSEKTKTDYLKNFKKYCDYTNKNPDELFKLKRTPLEFAVLLRDGSARA